MSIEDLANGAAVFALPLRNRFRNTDIRYGAVFQGTTGWGEFAPFPEYPDDVAGRWLAGALEQAFGQWPTPIRTQIPINAIIPIVDAVTTEQLVREAIAQGMTTIKVKVNDAQVSNSQADIERVAIIRRELDAHKVEGAIRIDVNAGWTVDQAKEQLPLLNEAARGLDYVEQPCRTFDELRDLKNVTLSWQAPVRIAVDESIRQAASLEVDAIREVADVVIVKSLPLGGVQRALGIIDAIGLPVVVSGSLDTSIGLAGGLQLAGCAPQLAGACGLGTGSLFAHDIVDTPLIPQDGILTVGRTSPNTELLDQASPSDEVVAEWRERIVRAWFASAHELVTEQVREAVLS